MEAAAQSQDQHPSLHTPDWWVHCTPFPLHAKSKHHSLPRYTFMRSSAPVKTHARDRGWPRQCGSVARSYSADATASSVFWQIRRLQRALLVTYKRKNETVIKDSRMAFLVSEERWWDETRWRSAAVRFTRITDVYETASGSKMTKKHKRI